MIARSTHDKVLARQTRDQMIELLKKGGFRFRKWASNAPDLLPDRILLLDKILQNTDYEHIKVLGIIWNPQSEIFHVAVPSSPGKTKRILAIIITMFVEQLG